MLRAVARSAGRRVTSWSTAPSTSTARERAGGTLAPSPHQHRPGAHHVGTPVASSVADDPSARVAARGYAKHSRRPHRNPAPSKPASDAKSKALRPVSASWTEVADPRTGTSYWWNKATGETRGLQATLDPPRTNSPRSTAEAPYRDPTIDTVNLPSVSRWDRCSSSGSAARSGSRSSASSRRGSPAAPPRNRRREKRARRRYRRRRDAARFVPGAIRSRRDSFQARFVPGAMIEPTPRCSRGASTPVLYRYESTRCVPRLISAPVPVSLPRLRGRRATRRSRAFARGHPQ